MMKKVAFAFIMLCTMSFALIAQDLPTFTGEGNATIFDTKTLKGKYGDKLQLINLTNEKNISFAIFALKNAKSTDWVQMGTLALNGTLDTVELESEEFEGKYNKYKYYAIVPQNGKKYDITMDTDLHDYFVIKHNILAFLIGSTSADTSYKKNAVILDMVTVQGKFKDQIKLVNKSSDNNFNIVVYGFDDENAESWELIAAAHLDGANDEDFADTVLRKYDVKKCKYYGFVFSNGKKYELNPYTARNDLYVEVK
ncbi:MAG: hypothetical protein J6I73_07570 [Treponema sp.]|nr:hypothetical protein [Treponema sp.]